MTVLLFFSLRNGGWLVSCLDPTHEPADVIQSFRRSVTALQFAADFGNNTPLNVKIAYGPQN